MGDQDHERFSTSPVVGFLVADLAAAVRELEAVGVELLGGQVDERRGGWRHFRAEPGAANRPVSTISWVPVRIDPSHRFGRWVDLWSGSTAAPWRPRCRWQDSSPSGQERWYHAAGRAQPRAGAVQAGSRPPGAWTVTQTGPPSARHSSPAALAVTSEDHEPSTAADREHLPDTGVRVSLAAYGHPDRCLLGPAWGPPPRRPASGRAGSTILAHGARVGWGSSVTEAPARQRTPDLPRLPHAGQPLNLGLGAPDSGLCAVRGDRARQRFGSGHVAPDRCCYHGPNGAARLPIAGRPR